MYTPGSLMDLLSMIYDHVGKPDPWGLGRAPFRTQSQAAPHCRTRLKLAILSMLSELYRTLKHYERIAESCQDWGWSGRLENDGWKSYWGVSYWDNLEYLGPDQEVINLSLHYVLDVLPERVAKSVRSTFKCTLRSLVPKGRKLAIMLERQFQNAESILERFQWSDPMESISWVISIEGGWVLQRDYEAEDQLREENGRILDRIEKERHDMIFEEEVRQEEMRKREADMARVERFFVLAALLTTSLLEAVLLFFNFSEYPNKHRPPCTTMPWSIPPALFVLWGVCWMFYYPQHPSPRNRSSSVPEVDTLQNISDESAHRTSLFHTPLDQPFDWPQADWQNTFQSEFNFDASTAFASSGNQLGPHLEAEGVFEFPAPFNLDEIAAGHQLVSSTDQVLIHSADYATLSEFHQHPPCSADAATVRNTNSPAQASATMGEQHMTLSSLPTTPPALPPTGSHTQIVIFSPESTSTGQLPPPPRDSDGRMVCDRIGCENVTFTTRRAWEVHRNKHNKPFKCNIRDCSHSTSTKGLLQRHKRSKHPDILSEDATLRPAHTLYFCPEPACDRSSSSAASKPFHRKDHRDEHVKRMHGNPFFNGPVNTPQEMTLPVATQSATNDSISNPSRNSVPIHAEAHHAGKQRRLNEPISSVENAGSTNAELHRVQKERDELKRKVANLEHELEASKKREEKLKKVVSTLMESA